MFSKLFILTGLTLVLNIASYETVKFVKYLLPYHDSLKGDLTNLYIGDFNGDGKDDFLRQEKGEWDDDETYTAWLFLSVGDRSFTKVELPEDFGLKGDLTNLYIGDFNGDGKDDFLRQEKGEWDDDETYTARLFLSVGDGSFTKVELPEEFGLKGDLTNLYIGDFNGDGKDDFLRQEKGEWDDDETYTAWLFLSVGDGSFTKVELPEEFGLKGDLTNLYIGDFNGDGKDDFLRQEKGEWDDDETYTARLFLSVGDGSFTKVELPEEFGLKGDLTNLYIGDFNGDGKDDFIRQEKGEWDNDEVRTAEVYLSIGDGSFHQVNFSPYLSPFFRGDLTNLYIGDFNGDGKDDFVKQEKAAWDDDDEYTAQVFLAIGDGYFVGTMLPENFGLKGDLTNIYIGDFNGDGRDDFIRQEKGAWALDNINTAEVFFSVKTTIPENKIKNYYVGDFNGDGFDDFLRQDQTNISRIYQSNGKDEFDKIFLDPNFALNVDFTTLYIGDFNGDGKDDILRQEKGSWKDDRINTATVLLAIEDNNFDKVPLPEEFDLNGDLTILYIGDFNGDGKDDFLRQEKGVWDDDAGNTANIFLSVGDGTFEKIVLPEEFDLKGDLTILYMGDFNGDKKDDFLRQEKGAWDDDEGNTANIFLSVGDGTFEKIVLPEEFGLKGDLTTLYVGDFDGDGKDDFIKQELIRSVATVFLSNGDGTFENMSLPENYSLKGSSTMLYTGDFDGNGKDDFFRQTKAEAWDANVGNVFLSNEATLFNKLADYKLRGDFTVLRMGDFNGDGKDDFLRVQTGLWGDQDFSALNVLLSLGDGTFEKKDIQELDPGLQKGPLQIKTEIASTLQRPLAKLANLLGYAWCGGPSGWIGEEFDIVESGDNVILKAQPSSYGYKSDERLQIVFSDWNFVIKDLQLGEVLTTEKVLKETDDEVVVNEDYDKVEQIGEISRTSTMTVNVYNLHTLSWKVGTKFVRKTQVSVPNVGGHEFSFEVSFEIGGSDQTGTVTANGNSTTVKQSVKDTVPPRKQRKLDLQIYGIKAMFDPSVAFIEAQFSVEFRGFLRWEGGANPNSNYHIIYRGSDERPTINYKLGNIETAFYDDLQMQLDFPGQSIWDWDLLREDHGTQLVPILNEIFHKSTYRDSYYFSMDAAQGTSLQVIVRKAEDLP